LTITEKGGKKRGDPQTGGGRKKRGGGGEIYIPTQHFLIKREEKKGTPSSYCQKVVGFVLDKRVVGKGGGKGTHIPKERRKVFEFNPVAGKKGEERGGKGTLLSPALPRGEGKKHWGGCRILNPNPHEKTGKRCESLGGEKKGGWFHPFTSTRKGGGGTASGHRARRGEKRKWARRGAVPW